ncbi:TPM domain-containing protein [uncultured Nostoc sp.]|uniref:TPM domain-containing protein n=1 Tax=uncultured Nostoc sp. TaxID=340711 RepID=UPI0035CC8BF3
MTTPIITQTCCVGFLSLSVITLSSASLAVSVEQVPNPRQVNSGWVTDMANVLSPSTEAELNKLISNLEAKNGSEIAVVTVPETSPAKTPKQFATALFKHWKIGKAERNNGVLLLISKGDRRVEIETGYGVKKILPDASVGNIIQHNITPRLKQGDYDGGTLAGIKALVTALDGVAHSFNIPTSNQSGKRPKDSSNQPRLRFVLGELVILGSLFITRQ